MTDLQALGAEVEWPDHESETAVRERLADADALGRLAELAEWVGGVAPGAVAEGFTTVRLVLLGGAEPSPVVQHLAGQVAHGLTQVHEFPTDIAEALDAGVALADQEIDAGSDLLVVAAPDPGVASLVAVSTLTNTEPVKVVARGKLATDPERWMALVTEIRDGRRPAWDIRNDHDTLLATIADPRLAFLTGLTLRAAARRTPVVLDGLGALAGALVAYEVQPRAVRWWCVADVGIEPAQNLVLNRMGQQPVLSLGTGLGDGAAGLLAVLLIQSAVLLSST
jgi:nicotinate-nucleotide--dimethylbenzimidazole phosphoribosyltransferase